MPIAIKMPALSPTMEEGTLARWLVKVGDEVRAGDVMAEIETDKATMEFEAVDEGTIADIAVPEGTEGVKVGTVIATLAEEGEDLAEAKKGDGAPAPAPSPAPAGKEETPAPTPARPEPVEGRGETADQRASTSSPRADIGGEDRIIASPLARRIAADRGIDLATVQGSGPNGRIVKADVEGAKPGAAPARPEPVEGPPAQPGEIPHEVEKLSSMRKVIARRLTESKQQIPHIYLTVDIRLDALLKLRAEINEALEGDGIKVSVNDMLVKALAKALLRVPSCNVQFAGDNLLKFSRADISVAVSIPGGLITPIVVDAGAKSVSQIAAEMKDLAGRAREGKLQPHEYQGGTASLSNLGMYGIKQFGAELMKAFKELCEKPLGLVA